MELASSFFLRVLFRDLEEVNLHRFSRGVIFAADEFLLSHSETVCHTLYVPPSVHVMELSLS